ncbi:MAG: DUF2147 domain-containing protein [Bernardetiaceae bacterium]|nr:DUF2147 domain-containing protein [Bernardetiaceae bacterium]
MSKQTRETLLEGVWMTGKKDAHVEITKKGNKYYGKIVWLEITHDENGNIRKDDLNPDESLRDHEIMGLEILKDFKYAGRGEWEDGTVYDPDTGNTYSGTMRIEDDYDKLKMRGYVGIALFGRTDVWTRVKA